MNSLSRGKEKTKDADAVLDIQNFRTTINNDIKVNKVEGPQFMSRHYNSSS